MHFLRLFWNLVTDCSSRNFRAVCLSHLNNRTVICYAYRPIGNNRSQIEFLKSRVKPPSAWSRGTHVEPILVFPPILTGSSSIFPLDDLRGVSVKLQPSERSDSPWIKRDLGQNSFPKPAQADGWVRTCQKHHLYWIQTQKRVESLICWSPSC